MPSEVGGGAPCGESRGAGLLVGAGLRGGALTGDAVPRACIHCAGLPLSHRRLSPVTFAVQG